MMVKIVDKRGRIWLHARESREVPALIRKLSKNHPQDCPFREK